MRWRLVALVSVGVNIALAAVWLTSTRSWSAKDSAIAAALGQPPPVQIRTNIVARRQLFSWQDLESGDYAIYVANLRDIGCPEQTIHDIIIADVNALYARKRATEVVTADQESLRRRPTVTRCC